MGNLTVTISGKDVEYKPVNKKVGVGDVITFVNNNDKPEMITFSPFHSMIVEPRGQKSKIINHKGCTSTFIFSFKQEDGTDPTGEIIVDD